MELKEFVSEALTAILEGVAEAQKGEHGRLVGPTFRFAMGHQTDHRGVYVHGSDNHTIVEFDVAVTSARTGEGTAKVGIKVLEIGGGKQRSEETASRIKFSVPIKLPQIEGT